MKSKSAPLKRFLMTTNVASITNKFDDYITFIGPNHADAIDIRNKPAYTSYLRTPSLAMFNFTYTNSDQVLIQSTKNKTKQSAGHDSISSILRKDIGRIIAPTISMRTSSNGNIFRVTGPLCREFTGHRWIPLTKASDAELWCFLWSAQLSNIWINNREDDYLRRNRAHYDVIVKCNHTSVNLKDVLSTEVLLWFRMD